MGKSGAHESPFFIGPSGSGKGRQELPRAGLPLAPAGGIERVEDSESCVEPGPLLDQNRASWNARALYWGSWISAETTISKLPERLRRLSNLTSGYGTSD